MKYYITLFVVGIISCGNSQMKNNDDKTITIKGITQYALSIGYGDVYACKTIENEYTFVPDTLDLVFVVGDTLQPLLKEKQIQIFTFEKEQLNVPYSHMPTTGFVDKDMTLWKLISIK